MGGSSVEWAVHGDEDGGEHASSRLTRASPGIVACSWYLMGLSLVYRAFYALPESIATSTGVPTNAIFGFASMLVKIVTEYGVLARRWSPWDAGTSGWTELFEEYKSTRRSRPDLLKQQWPAMGTAGRGVRLSERENRWLRGRLRDRVDHRARSHRRDASCR